MHKSKGKKVGIKANLIKAYCLPLSVNELLVVDNTSEGKKNVPNKKEVGMLLSQNHSFQLASYSCFYYNVCFYLQDKIASWEIYSVTTAFILFKINHKCFPIYLQN